MVDVSFPCSGLSRITRNRLVHANTAIHPRQVPFFCVHPSAVNMCGKTLTITRVRQHRFCIEMDTPRNRTRSLSSFGENATLMNMIVYNLRTQIAVSYGLEHERLQTDSSICREESKNEVLCGNTWTSLFSCRGRQLTYTFKTLLSINLEQLRRDSLGTEACSMYSQHVAFIFRRLFCYRNTQAFNPCWYHKSCVVLCRIMLHGRTISMTHTKTW